MLNYCKHNGIVLLSFPTHTSQLLQVLDQTVYGPLKRLFNTFTGAWLSSHPGIPMTIYDIPTVLKEALPRAATPNNIQSGFLPLQVTNRDFELPCTSASEVSVDQAAQSADIRRSRQIPQPSISTFQDSPYHSALCVTSQQLKSFPKAGTKKESTNRLSLGILP